MCKACTYGCIYGIVFLGKKAKANFAPTFYEHVDTAQLAYNLDAFKAGDIVQLTLKIHGTSGRTGYLPLIHYKQSLFDKIFHRIGKEYKKYGYVSGTRRVVLDATHTGGYYDDNSFREEMAKKFEGKLHKGEVCYYEIAGFQDPNGAPIMASVKNSKISDKAFTKQYGEETIFSYGCEQNGHYDYLLDEFGNVDLAPCCDVYVYRMTMTNEDGEVVEYTPDFMRYRCEQIGVKVVPLFWRGIIPTEGSKIIDMETNEEYVETAGEFIKRIAENYYDGPDPIGKTHVREGVVVRIINRPKFTAYKHKNFLFKQISGIISNNVSETSTDISDDILAEL